MNHLSIARTLVSALALLLLLTACGPLSIDPLDGLGADYGTTTSSDGSGGLVRDLTGRWHKVDGAEPWTEAGALVRDLAEELGRDAPHVIALHDAATWRREGAVVHDDVDLLLDELWQRGLAYEVASEVLVREVVLDDVQLAIRHLLLVREGTAATLSSASHGAYASGHDAWAAAELATPAGPVTIVVTGLASGSAGSEVDELLDVLALSAGRTIVACGLDLADPAVGTLCDAGYAPTRETADGLVLERDAVAPEGR